MDGPSAELSAQYATAPADYLLDSDDRAAFTNVVATALWGADDAAAAIAEALLGIVEAIAFAAHDAVERGECDPDRFREWIGGSIEVLAERIAAIERAFAIMSAEVGHA